jgi:potassium-dependent mechanosensitive channel
LITPAILYGSVLALSLYAFVRVISGAVAIALRTWPLQKLHMVVNHCDLIERRISRVLSLSAAVIWVNRSIEYVGLLDPVRSAFSAILDFKLERQSISVSVEDVLFFGLTVWASYLLSAFIRFALQSERDQSFSVAVLLLFAAVTQ